MSKPREKYFLDTEFIEDGKTIDLISIALVCDDGRELYLVNQDAQLHRANDWVRANVLPLLPRFGTAVWSPRSVIAEAVRTFIRPAPVEQGAPEIWGYYADYDWVALCQLFGTMMDLPNHLPMFCMDLRQWSHMLGNPEHPKQLVGEHIALGDARWNKELYEMLAALQRNRDA